MKFQTLLKRLAIAVTAVVLVGFGIFYGVVSRRPLGLIEQGGQSLPAATQFVPKQAPLTASLLAKPDRLIELWRYLARPGVKRDLNLDIERLEDSLLAGTGLSYQRDIQPWLGEEITFSVVTADLDQIPDNGSQPGYLLVLSCRDSQQAKGVLELFWQNRAVAGDTLGFERFAGNTLVYADGAQTQTRTAYPRRAFQNLATTVVGNQFVLVANSPLVLEQALISAQADDLSLDNDWRYQQALAALPPRRVGLLTLNLPQSLTWLDNSADPTPMLHTAGLGRQDNFFDRAVISLGLTKQGVLGETMLLAAHGHEFKLPDHPSATGNIEATEFLPKNSSLVSVGQDFQQLRADLADVQTFYGDSFKPLTTLLMGVASHLPDPMADEMLGWIADDYAFGLVNTVNRRVEDWVLVAKHQEQSKAAIHSLDNLAQEQGMSIGPLEISGYQATVWTRLFLVSQSRGEEVPPDLTIGTTISGLHVPLDNYEIFTTSPTALTAVVNNYRQPSADLPKWGQFATLLNAADSNFAYIDWAVVQSQLTQSAPWFRLVETVGKPVLRHFQSLTLAGKGRSVNAQTSRFFLELSNRY